MPRAGPFVRASFGGKDAVADGQVPRPTRGNCSERGVFPDCPQLAGWLWKPHFSLGDPSWQSNSLIWPLPSTHPGPVLFFINAPAASHPHTENQPSCPACQPGVGKEANDASLGYSPARQRRPCGLCGRKRLGLTSPLLPPPSFYCIAFG